MKNKENILFPPSNFRVLHERNSTSLVSVEENDRVKGGIVGRIQFYFH